MPTHYSPLDASFRDPAGYVFEKEGIFYRQVNKIFQEDFDFFLQTGCYDQLVKKELLIPHTEVRENLTGDPNHYKTLLPDQLSFVSYPYEWCFDMLKDAALLTLKIARECLRSGVMLRDATPYNVQWQKGRMIFIDTLSFEKYDATKPWIAYRQFCEAFLAPLLLMHYSGQPLQGMMQGFPEGIPLQIASSLLPVRSRFSLSTYLHLHLHAKFTGKKFSPSKKEHDFSEKKLSAILDSLYDLVNGLQWKGATTTWENYYDEASQRDGYLEKKKAFVLELLNQSTPFSRVIDLGANEGFFSEMTAARNACTIATDADHAAINNLYVKEKKKGGQYILPLLLDLANPTPAIGLQNTERPSFLQRTKVDLALALAIIHHLSIGKNIPFERTAATMAGITDWLIIEFVPREDEKVQVMLSTKKDIYNNYDEPNFLLSFEKYFSIKQRIPVPGTYRTLYLMKRNEK
jgi:hypothetical protein